MEGSKYEIKMKGASELKYEKYIKIYSGECQD